MVLLLLKQGLRDEYGQVDILMAQLFELAVQNALDVLPDGVAVGPVDEHALDRGVVDELRLFAHVSVPLGKINLHIGDLADLLAFVLCHSFSILLQQNQDFV